MYKICLLFALSLFSYSCTHTSQNKNFKSASEYSKAKEFASGKLIIIQGPTSANETNINILSPVLKKYIYVVKDEHGKTYNVEHYDSIHTPPLHWKVDKIIIKGLNPGIKS